MSKRISVALCLLLVVAMAFTVVGCSNNAAEESTPPTAETDPSEPAAEDDGAADAQEAMTLEFWDMSWGPAGVYDTLAEEIAQRYTETAPNVTVEYTNSPWANWFEMYSTAVASGDAPDVGIGGGFMPFQFAVNGEAADVQWIVDQYIAEGQESDFLEGALDYYMYDGVHVGIPFNYDTRAMYIRKDWLQELNLEMPTTYEELIEVAKAFSAKDENTYGMVMGVTSNNACPFTALATGNGGAYYNEDGSANVNHERNLQVMKLLRTLKDEGCLPDGMENFTGDEAVALFEGGYVGMCQKAGGDFKQAAESMGTDKVALVPPFKSPSGVCKGQICVNGYMIFEQSPNKQQAMEFLKWYTENNGELWTTQAMDAYPARISMLNDESMQTEIRQDVIQNILTNGVTFCYPLINGTASASSIEGLEYDQKIIQAALLNEESTWADTLGEIEEEVQSLIDDMDP